MDILQGLNDKQKDAVMTIDGNIRVTAGAGSGKTRVLAHRYAFLVNEVGINPSNILCMTSVYDFYKQSCTGNEEPY